MSEHIEALRREGGMLADAAAAADPDATVPTCPEWTVRELVQHTGRVHTWAAAYVREGRTVPFEESDADRLFGPMPDDAALVDWYRERHGRLVEALDKAPADLACWAFLPAPSPLAFWARRQAHETAIHRADADSALGPIRGYPPEFAADGVDELLRCFMVRSGRLRTEQPRSLHVHATDTGDDWTVHMGPEEVHCGRTAEPADCSLRAPVGDLYLALWNRRGTDDLSADGDRDVLAFWREKATVRWG